MEAATFESALRNLPRYRTHLLPALLLAQRHLGSVPDRAVERIAAHLRLTVNDVEGVVTSYPDLRRQPAGAHVVRVCTGVSCLMAGGDRLLSHCESLLGIGIGDTTSDGQVTLQETSCGFLCAAAPVVEVDGMYRGRATTGEVQALVTSLAAPPSATYTERRGDVYVEHPRSAGTAVPPPPAFASLVAAATARVVERQQGQVARLLVGMGECCQAVGAHEVLAALQQGAATRGLPVGVVAAGCTGMCSWDVQVTLQRPGLPDLTWNRVVPDHAAALVDIAMGQRPAGTVPGAFTWGPDSPEGHPGIASVPALAGQRRILLEYLGRCDPVDMDEALARGAYRGLARSLSLTPNEVIETVKRAGLAGRGGAYFPTGMKWEGCRGAGDAPRYLIVNAEEGEPGVYKDRHLLEGDPHLVIAGALIAAYALDASRVFLYLNGEAGLAHERLVAALEQTRAWGLAGERILGSDFSCEVEVRVGGGGYVLGEETVILESIEGHRAMPRVRPPYAHEAGLQERPTVINNVETLANLPAILDRGADWFAGLGTDRWKGTKLLCVAGDVAHPGLVEVEMGTPLRRVLLELCGGVQDGRSLQAVLTEGPSGNFIPPDLLATPLEPRLPDVMLGSGNLIVLDDRRSILEIVRRLTRYNAAESCGKCTPCREGVNRMREILDRAAQGHARPSDREDLDYLCDIAASASLCGLGQMAPNPVRSALRFFGLPGLPGSPEDAHAHRDR